MKHWYAVKQNGKWYARFLRDSLVAILACEVAGPADSPADVMKLVS